jgi:hypothetical protein
MAGRTGGSAPTEARTCNAAARDLCCAAAQAVVENSSHALRVEGGNPVGGACSEQSPIQRDRAPAASGPAAPQRRASPAKDAAFGPASKTQAAVLRKLPIDVTSDAVATPACVARV